MTATTRRLVFFSVLLAALTLPAESILLRAITTPDQKEAIQKWAAELSEADLQEAARTIQTYPFAYRRAIMTVLTPADRAIVWRDHLLAYIPAHPELDGGTVALIGTAAAISTPEVFTEPTPEARASLHAVADQLIASIGREQTDYLLYRLGPPDGPSASAEPLQMRWSNAVRGWFSVLARVTPCDCAMYWGCGNARCSQQEQCAQENGWPQCGWFWMDPCDGLCIY